MTRCRSCGLPVPLNGPVRTTTCASCFNAVVTPGEIYIGFFNDFEGVCNGIEDGQGQEGTVLAGGATYTYGFYRMAPRCEGCREALPEVSAGTDGKFACPACGRAHDIYPAPSWITAAVPSAAQCICADREDDGGDKTVSGAEGESARPVAMNCPQCGGGLLVSGASERIMQCRYCQVDVYIPDPVWLRLHPVKTVRKWYMAFEGESPEALNEVRRAEDLKKEKEDLKGRRPGTGSKNPAITFLHRGLKAGAGILFFFLLIAGTLLLLRHSPLEIGEIFSRILVGIAIAAFAVLTLYSVLHMEIAFRFRGAGKCRRAMISLAEKNKWKYTGIEYKNTMGSITAKIKGREFSLDPDNNHALKVDIESSPFYLSTDPPGFPGDDLVRFTAGVRRFDELFPIRYAERKIAGEMEKMTDRKNLILSSFLWFLDRWEVKLGKMLIDSSGIHIHLLPGYEESFINPVRYLNPEDIEPLIQDTMVLAAALEAAVMGKKPELT